jgi:hypothetical protein
MMRHVTVLAFLVWGVAWGQTFQVKSGVWPWHDRVNQWQLVDVPDQLVSDDAIPQQSCGSRGLVFPKGLKAAVVAMNSSDANRLVSKLKIPLRETDLKVTIQSPDGKKRLPYPVFVYPNPPEKLDSKGNARAGLLLLKLSDDGIKSRPFTAKAAPAGGTKAAAKLVPPEKTLAERASFHLYLLVGQSNMAGRGTIEAVDLSINPRVLSLNKDNRWVVAMDPLHTDKPSIAGVGLGTTFGKEMAKADPNAVIGLIPCAVGGTSISQWRKGAPPTGNWGKLYDNAIERAKIAQRDGVLKGILWHQGEADCSPTNIAAYQERLTKLVANFRQDLKAPDVPFLAGTLGVWDPKRHASRKAFNDNLAGLPTWFAKAAVVDAGGLPHRGDNTHFSSASLRELGRRFAKAMQAFN